MEKLNTYRKDGKDLYEYINANPPRYPYREIPECMEMEDGYRKFNISKFSDLWYLKQFKPHNKKILDLYNDIYYTKEDLTKMSIEFLRTFQWVQYYYTKGLNYVSDYHFYPYMFTPLSITLENQLRQIIKHDLLEF